MKEKISLISIVFIIATTFFIIFIKQQRFYKINDFDTNKLNIPNQCLNNLYPNPCFHLSIDDSIGFLEDLTKNKARYKSAFDQPFLALLKELHDKFGSKITLYFFYQTNGFSLADATAEYAKEFKANSDWLKFGFHAVSADFFEKFDADIELEFYKKTIAELTRISSSANISYFLRLDRFIANEKAIEKLSKNGLLGLFIAEQRQKRINDALSDEELTVCYKNDWFVDKYGVKYTPTDVRIEIIESDDQFYENFCRVASQPQQVIFTHEWETNKTNTKKYLRMFAMYARQINANFNCERME
ncbi:hypothetical protein IKR20_04335 [bacterium]|nr:hypothetical protein [bacterium]